jgi:hypothetical protein
LLAHLLVTYLLLQEVALVVEQTAEQGAVVAQVVIALALPNLLPLVLLTQ